MQLKIILWYLSTCTNGKWECGQIYCDERVQCPGNLVYSEKASACPKTCDNYKNYIDCQNYFEGCTCPEGKVLSSDVNELLFALFFTWKI